MIRTRFFNNERNKKYNELISIFKKNNDLGGFMSNLNFNDEFMFGTATSSTQIEGGDRNNTWYQWCEDGRIWDSSNCVRACDHWDRIDEDTELLKKLHVQTHRMSLEWSRIQPAAESFSEEAIQHYRYEIQLLLDNNIKPLISLHHFSDPIWFQEMGGWSKSENSDIYIQYVKYVVEKLGDLVCEWVTFNEPNVYIIFGYLLGIFPPGKRNVAETFKLIGELIHVHIRIYDLIHKTRSEFGFEGKTMVGAAIHFRIFDGITYSGKLTAKFVDYIFHELFVTGMTKGKLTFPLKNKHRKIRKGKYMDFLGVNYYTRNIVEFAFDPSNYFYRFMHDNSLNKSDLNWDIYPKGIYRVCKRYYKKCHIPIYITENGISDKYDNRRPNFIIQHLAYIHKAIKEGIPVKRYYHWTLMDNFEWTEGETAKFGLYHCNFENQERTARNSAELYANICREKEIRKEMVGEF